ncbi:C-type lectin domain family 4 member M-like [Esox lucius]|uniref:C-type lectin domain family 4 member M-like n=1 Tax=Esox lucius TaxID=8010 RepID=UPI0014773B5E|nr:C-type lectin domain family 4 member M-like [Esox lucius]
MLKQSLVLKGCPPRWKRFARSCYFISTQKGTWKNSRRDCQGRGADLAVITSPEEQAFMKSLNYGAWLGLTSADAEGAWMWVDGTTLTTGYWNQGEPSNAGGTEDCVHLYLVDGSPLRAWNDAPCYRDNHWICEKPLG